jgi:hypothetical protein
MNTENEKKWFVYIGDHHEGPLSEFEVYQRKQKGQVNPDSYVWREGMADWVLLSQVADLTQAIEALKAAEPPPSAKPHLELAPVPEPETPGAPTDDSTGPHDGPGIPQEASSDSSSDFEPLVNASPAAEAKVAKRNSSKASSTHPRTKQIASKALFAFGATVSVGISLFVFALVGLVLGSRSNNTKIHTRIRPVVERVVEKAPYLRPAFKMTPSLSDVSAEDMADLENARVTGPEAGVKIGIGLSDAEPTRPAFYVTTNLPNRTKFEILIIGNPETLLNRMHYTSQVTVTPHYGFGKSEAFLTENGQALPKGDYRVYVFESAEQPETIKAQLENLPSNRTPEIAGKDVPKGAKFVASRGFFLGGERDENYLTRLKSFHDAIKEKAEKELVEIKQYSETLAAQHSILTEAFMKIFRSRKIAPPQRSSWEKTADTWNKIAEQLDQTVQTWSKETLQNEFFYGKAYEAVKNAFQSLRDLVKLESSFVARPGDRSAFEIQHGKLLSESREALEILRRKVDIMAKAPKTPSGLPTREGL